MLYFAMMTTAIVSVAGWGPIKDAVFRETRIVQDLAMFNFREIIDNSDQLWAVVHVRPDPRSGLERRIVTEIRGETGEIVSVPGGRYVTVFSGSYELITTLSGAATDQSSDYQLELPSGGGGTGGTIAPKKGHHPYVPLFIDGGVAICRIVEDATGREKFPYVILIPAEWKDFVKPALEYLRDNSRLFEPNGARVNRVALRELVDDENPLLSAAALRTLAHGGELDNIVTTERARSTRGIRQALSIFVALRYGAQDDLDGFETQVGEFVDTAENVGQVRAVALGAWAASNDIHAIWGTREREQHSARLITAKNLLGKIDARERTPRSTGKDIKYVNEILELSGRRRGK